MYIYVPPHTHATPIRRIGEKTVHVSHAAIAHFSYNVSGQALPKPSDQPLRLLNLWRLLPPTHERARTKSTADVDVPLSACSSRLWASVMQAQKLSVEASSRPSAWPTAQT